MPEDTLAPPPDPFASFEDAWRAFLACDALQLSGVEIPAFARGRAQFLAFIARVEDAAAREYISLVSKRLGDINGVELFPDWYWHITIKGAGFQVIKRSHEDDILRQDLSRLASQAKAALARAKVADAQLGPPNVLGDAAVLEFHDGGTARTLNESLRDNIEGIAHYPSDGECFLPHVSIARFTSNDGLDDLKAALSELRTKDPGPRFQLRRIELIRAWLSEGVAEFDTLATYPLTAASSLGAAP